jgi:hypothetical protein
LAGEPVFYCDGSFFAVPIALPEIENFPKNIKMGIKKRQNLVPVPNLLKKLPKKVSITK